MQCIILHNNDDWLINTTYLGAFSCVGRTCGVQWACRVFCSLLSTSEWVSPVPLCMSSSYHAAVFQSHCDFVCIKLRLKIIYLYSPRLVINNETCTSIFTFHNGNEILKHNYIVYQTTASCLSLNNATHQIASGRRKEKIILISELDT